MTILPLLYMPCVLRQYTPFTLEYETDEYRPIFSNTGATLTTITRKVPDAESITFLELSFIDNLTSYLQAREFIQLTINDISLGQDITLDCPLDMLTPITRAEFKPPADQQRFIEYDTDFSIVWTRCQGVKRIIIRYKPVRSVLALIRNKWMWKFEFLLRTKQPLSVDNLAKLRADDDDLDCY